VTSPDIVYSYPPNIDDIAKVFPMAKDLPNVIFAYGHTIYSPSKEKIPIPVLKHEFVHCERQGTAEDGIIEWWDKYLKDIDFRYMEERIAHIAEYVKACELSIHRNARRVALKEISTKLSHPLYGRMVTFQHAKIALKNGLILAKEGY